MFARARTFLIARLALALFVLTQAMAVAAPLAEQPTGQLVCTAAGGFQWIVIDPDGALRDAGLPNVTAAQLASVAAPDQSMQANEENWRMMAQLGVPTTGCNMRRASPHGIHADRNRTDSQSGHAQIHARAHRHGCWHP